tara:strand:+ start:6155 stop:7243 length:1089 start_codon:yes stop_codon:yes gene_type:complete
MQKKISRKKNIIYFIPVPKEFIKLWVWYNIDLSILKECNFNVIVCNSFYDLVINIFNVDLVYGWWWNRMMPAVILCKLLNKKIISSGAIHMLDNSGSSDYHKKSFLYKLFTSISLKNSDVNIFMSRDQFLSITSHIKTNNPQLVYSCTKRKLKQINDSHKLKKLWLDSNFDENNKRINKLEIATVCWLTKDQINRKGVILLLESLVELKNRSSFLPNLTIIGKAGDALPFIKNFIDENRLNNYVEVRTNLSSEDKDNILFKSHFYVQSSWYEGFGNAVLEAMELGTPALVSRYSAQPEVVGESGIINYDQTPKGLADKIEFIFQLDKDSYLDLMEKSYQRIKHLFLYEGRRDSFKKILDKLS